MKPPASQLTLPGGFEIRLAYRTDKQIRAAANEECYGYWVQGKKGGKIVLNKDVPQWRQLKTFGHELVHAVHDYGHWVDMLADELREADEKFQRELEEEEKEE